MLLPLRAGSLSLIERWIESLILLVGVAAMEGKKAPAFGPLRKGLLSKVWASGDRVTFHAESTKSSKPRVA